MKSGPRLIRPSALEWSCLAGGLLLTLHHAWLLDDAYIYFRYVDNLVLLGNGLVYNRGEYVEGFTSPAWTLLLGLARSTGLDYWLLVRGIGLLCFAGFAALLVALERRLSPVRGPVLNVPLIFLSFNYGVLCYFTSGTESPLVLLFAPVSALFVLAPGSASLQVALAFAPLVRPELALVTGVGVLWAWRRERRIPWRLLALAAGMTGAWLLFRIVYYADLLPNTFYLKNASAWGAGLRYLADTLLAYGLLVAVLLLLGLAAVLRNRQRVTLVPERIVMLAMAAFVTLYVVKVGGDARHFRYLAFPFTLAVCAGGGVLGAGLARWATPIRRGLVVTAGMAIALASLAQHPRQTSVHPLSKSAEPRLVEGIADAIHHRQHDRLPHLTPWKIESPFAQLPRPASIRAALAAHGYEGVLVEHICWRFYEHLDLRALHNLGLTEPVLARVDLPFDRPGHKWALIPLARDLARIQRWWAREPVPGMFRAAVSADAAPSWIADNLASLETIERKIYNHHRFGENLALAISFPERLRPPERPATRPSTTHRQRGAAAAD